MPDGTSRLSTLLLTVTRNALLIGGYLSQPLNLGQQLCNSRLGGFGALSFDVSMLSFDVNALRFGFGVLSFDVSALSFDVSALRFGFGALCFGFGALCFGFSALRFGSGVLCFDFNKQCQSDSSLKGFVGHHCCFVHCRDRIACGRIDQAQQRAAGCRMTSSSSLVNVPSADRTIGW